MIAGSLGDGDILAIQSPGSPERTLSGLVRRNICPGSFKKGLDAGLGRHSLLANQRTHGGGLYRKRVEWSLSRKASIRQADLPVASGGGVASGRGFPTAWAYARSGWGPRAWAGRAVSVAEPDAGGAAAAAALGMGGAPAASAGGRCERPPLLPRVAASQGGGMLGKGVVGGGGGTKAPKPSFVSYVRPEVRGRRAGGASDWSGRGEGRLQPLTRRRKSRGRFLPGCRRGA